MRDGVAIEVTGRAARRHRGGAAAADARPRPWPAAAEPGGVEPPSPEAGPVAPLHPIARASFDYGDLEAALREAEAAIRRTRACLDQLACGGWAPCPATWS